MRMHSSGRPDLIEEEEEEEKSNNKTRLMAPVRVSVFVQSVCIPARCIRRCAYNV